MKASKNEPRRPKIIEFHSFCKANGFQSALVGLEKDLKRNGILINFNRASSPQNAARESSDSSDSSSSESEKTSPAPPSKASTKVASIKKRGSEKSQKVIKPSTIKAQPPEKVCDASSSSSTESESSSASELEKPLASIPKTLPQKSTKNVRESPKKVSNVTEDSKSKADPTDSDSSSEPDSDSNRPLSSRPLKKSSPPASSKAKPSDTRPPVDSTSSESESSSESDSDSASNSGPAKPSSHSSGLSSQTVKSTLEAASKRTQDLSNKVTKTSNTKKGSDSKPKKNDATPTGGVDSQMATTKPLRVSDSKVKPQKSKVETMKKPVGAQKDKAESSSDSDSDSDSDSSEAKPQAAQSKAKSSSESDSDSNSSVHSKPSNKPTEEKGKLMSSPIKRRLSSPGIQPAPKRPRASEPLPSGMNATKSNDHLSSNFNQKSNQDPKQKKGNTPFRRVKAEEIALDHRLQDNSFLAKGGAQNSYGYKAHQALSVTRGKAFTKEKNKKKRGSYRGGIIDTTSHSIKFD